MFLRLSTVLMLVYSCTAIPGLTFMSPRMSRSSYSFTGSIYPTFQRPRIQSYQAYRPTTPLSFGSSSRAYSRFNDNDFDFRDRYRSGRDDRYNSYNDRFESYTGAGESYSRYNIRSRDVGDRWNPDDSDYRVRRPYMSQSFYGTSHERDGRGYTAPMGFGRGFGAQIGRGVYIPYRSSSVFGGNPGSFSSYSSTGYNGGPGGFSSLGSGSYNGGLGRISSLDAGGYIGGLGRISSLGAGGYNGGFGSLSSIGPGSYNGGLGGFSSLGSGGYTGGLGGFSSFGSGGYQSAYRRLPSLGSRGYTGGLGRYLSDTGRYSGGGFNRSLRRGFPGSRFAGGRGFSRRATNSYYRNDDDDD